MIVVDFFLRVWNWLRTRRDSLAALQAKIERLEEEKARDKSHFESMLKIRETEMAGMVDVIARDRERVHAETAQFVAQRESAIRPQQASG